MLSAAATDTNVAKAVSQQKLSMPRRQSGSGFDQQQPVHGWFAQCDGHTVVFGFQFRMR